MINVKIQMDRVSIRFRLLCKAWKMPTILPLDCFFRCLEKWMWAYFLISSIICKLCIQTWLFVFRLSYFLQDNITRVANCGFPIIVCFSSCFIGKDFLPKHIMVLHPIPSIHLAFLLLENQMLMLIWEFIDS